MFGQSKPVVIDRYGSRRSRWRLPRWLVLLLVGIALGAAAVVIVQERYLPPRLTAAASAQLSAAFDEADTQRLRLKNELGSTTQRLAAAQAETKRLGDELGASRASIERLRADVASVVAGLPPDPRGGGVEVRAGKFSLKDGMLAFEVVLTRERAAGPPLAGALQLVITGDGLRGADATVTLKPVALALGSFEVVRGSLPLPEGLRPRQATIQVLDRVGGKLLGMRVMLVR